MIRARLPALIFVHIPKASGTTMAKILRRWCDAADVYEVGSRSREDDAAELGRRRDTRLVLGHAAFGLHAAMPIDFRYVTVLREPIARFLSHFHYIRRTSQHPLHERVRSGQMTIRDFARKVPNLQTRYLGGLIGGAPTEATLALAKENLERHFAVAGLVERFEETVVLMHRAFGQPVRPFVSENVAARTAPTDVSGEDLREIDAQHVLDRELYEFVRARFAQQVAAQGFSFAPAVRMLRLGNRAATVAAGALRACRALGR